ncbi:MAG: S41 family peptidase, partial [candidate division Zixibacteria bacterium]|nr:S41 family peptidase [candidate division Zixibacteria bacterium]
EQTQFDWMDEKLSGDYPGIGVTIVPNGDGLVIVSVREGGPAHGAGLLTGDVILLADSTALAGLDFEKAAVLLRGKEKTPVRLTVFRPADSDTLTFTVVRDKIPFVHVPYAGFTFDSVAYIRVLDFDPGAARDIEAVLDSLMPAGSAGRPRGLILDLRSNPGGLFNEALQTADLFLDKGAFIVGIDGRSRWYAQDYHATGSDLTSGVPMVVMVDRGSASASEIVAGALQQAGRAILVGDTTFGKGLVQGFVHFPDGDGLRLTISRYYFSGGVYLNEFDSVLNDVGHGLLPDHYYPSDDRGHFSRALENTRLLQQFANRHQDEIVTAARRGALDDQWVKGFILFAEGEKYDYVSPLTRQIETIRTLAKQEGAAPAVVHVVERLLQAGRRNDWNIYYVHRDYIKRRLKEIAIERKYGAFRAYDEVIVNESPAIQFATGILLEDR